MPPNQRPASPSGALLQHGKLYCSFTAAWHGCFQYCVLLQDIYIARAEGELALEEELYWTLISIYRLPSLMFELTKKQQ